MFVGRTGVNAAPDTRVFHFAGGDAVMSDEIGMTKEGLTDRLGRHGIVAATFDAPVVTARVLRETFLRDPANRAAARLAALEPQQTARQSA